MPLPITILVGWGLGAAETLETLQYLALRLPTCAVFTVGEFLRICGAVSMTPGCQCTYRGTAFPF